MQYHIEKGERGFCRLSCSFGVTEVQEAWKKAAAYFGSSVTIPGFRKGKAPLAALEKQFGQQMADFATDKLVSRAVEQALQREELEPVSGFEYEGQRP